MKRSSGSTTLKELKELKGALKLLQRNNVPGVNKPRRADERQKHKTDEEIFREAMADVREIKEYRKIPFRMKRQSGIRSPRRKDDLVALKEIVEGKRKIRLSDTGEYIEWTMPDFRKDMTRRLHRGDFAVQDSIDLHGMTLGEAEEALAHFFREAVRRRLFCVKVIHGRGLGSPGGPVLKEALKSWLHGIFGKWTAAYVTAKDCDGGLGATYIVLRLK
jgi:DNA-nicking Smr family endonuclease